MRENLKIRALLKLYSEKNNAKIMKVNLELCVICGQGSGIQKCPAERNLKNGLEIYHSFLLSVKELAELQSMPVPIHFNKEDAAETGTECEEQRKSKTTYPGSPSQ